MQVYISRTNWMAIVWSMLRISLRQTIVDGRLWKKLLERLVTIAWFVYHHSNRLLNQSFAFFQHPSRSVNWSVIKMVLLETYFFGLLFVWLIFFEFNTNVNKQHFLLMIYGTVLMFENRNAINHYWSTNIIPCPTWARTYNPSLTWLFAGCDLAGKIISLYYKR